MEEYIDIKAKHDGKALDPGHSTDIKSVKVTLDPVVTTHRPLIWYTVRAFICKFVWNLENFGVGIYLLSPRRVFWDFFKVPRKLQFAPSVMTMADWLQIVGLLDMATSLGFYSAGFQHYAPRKIFAAFPPRPITAFSRKSPVKELSYWYRPHKSTTKLPIVFIHGIGVSIFKFISYPS